MNRVMMKDETFTSIYFKNTTYLYLTVYANVMILCSRRVPQSLENKLLCL